MKIDSNQPLDLNNQKNKAKTGQADSAASFAAALKDATESTSTAKPTPKADPLNGGGGHGGWPEVNPLNGGGGHGGWPKEKTKV